ncbi:MAG: sarcosine oxidase subunit gamma [Rhizobiaceae bacterium]
MADPLRRPALDGRAVARRDVTIMPAGPAHRVSLRAPSASVAPLSKALGVKLPTAPKASASANGRVAMWLGPDEWLVIDEAMDPLAALAGVKAPHSAVDVSHRNVGIGVDGVAAADTIAGGCPQNLSLPAFPVGACSRTILGKAEIVLWRSGETAFRVECWRSFSTYVFDFLEEAARDKGA